jgi:serine protease Do
MHEHRNEMRLKSRTRLSWTISGLALAAMIGVGAVASGLGLSPSAALVGDARAQSVQGAPFDFADVAEKVRPAVVSIEVRSTSSAVRRRGFQPRGEDQREDRFFGLPEDHPLREFFRRFGEGAPQAPDSLPSRSAGSGFFISADGFIVTNNHVIEGADRIEVTVGEERRKYEATLVGADPRTDLALLKVEGRSDFPFLEFADKPARVGEWVLAVGNPFGLGGSVSAGIVSAQGRDIGSSPYDYMQIDAAVNRGNSGGPAVNLEGKVVGVNTAIFSPSGGNVGIAFAVPASVAQEVITQLRDSGKVSRGWLGVTIQDVTEDLAAGLGMDADDPHGAIVTTILEDGPSMGSDLLVGDTIVAVQGDRVNNSRDLARKIAAISPGTDARLSIYRNGEKNEISVMLGTFPSSPQEVAALEQPRPSGAELEDLGLTLAPASSFAEGEDDARRKGDSRGSRNDGMRGRDLGSMAKGVAIIEVDPTSVAADQGLQRGDVIVAVGDASVDTPAQVADGVATARERGRPAVVFQIRRGEQQRFVALPLEARR